MTPRTSTRCILATTLLGLGIGVFAASSGFAQGDPERNAYFGQTHVHTSWSFDAYVSATPSPGRTRRTNTRLASRSSTRAATWFSSSARSTFMLSSLDQV
jgi:hypothetical protein